MQRDAACQAVLQCTMLQSNEQSDLHDCAAGNVM